MVGKAGIEPTTPGLEGRCSIQLSYSPGCLKHDHSEYVDPTTIREKPSRVDLSLLTVDCDNALFAVVLLEFLGHPARDL